jgi:hypothetical protein
VKKKAHAPFSSERTFVILKRVNKVPSLAACSSCQRKFFTLATYHDDPARAEQYLHDKFVMHRCQEETNLRLRRAATANPP